MKYVLCLMLVLSTGCGLIDDIPPFTGQSCGGACGPCDLGTFDCNTKTCSVSFEGVNDDALCVGDQASIVFVRAGATGGDGSREKPLGSISQALARQKARVILVAGADTYEGPLVLTDGVTIEGGWTKDFVRDTKQRARIKTTQSTDGHLFGIIAKNLDRATTLRFLTIQNENATEGSNVGIYSKDVKELRLVSLNVKAGNGQDGTNGDAGLIGTAGTNGALGGIGEVWLGGNGGENLSCPDAKGGTGGDGEQRQGGNVRPATPGGKSTLGSDEAPVGDDGFNGSNGMIGLNGEEAQKGVLNQLGLWSYPMLATAGMSGSTGAGGGGGGGAAINRDGTGGGGGGGGAGGCGGTGGQPGTSGWPSFGILAINTQLYLDKTDVASGKGGDAGLGGQGGAGAVGGMGGNGMQSIGTDSLGGDGGAGGQGGQGGRGGHGQAGLSVGLYCQGSVLRQAEQSDIDSGVGGEQASGEPLAGKDVFQCSTP